MPEQIPRERRKFKRYAAKDGAMAILVSAGEDHLNLYRIVNISREGLAFEYKSSSGLEGALSTMEIMGIYRPAFWIREVPYRIIFDHEGKPEAADNIRTRRCGLVFGKLSKEQIRLMGEFIGKYAFVKRAWSLKRRISFEPSYHDLGQPEEQARDKRIAKVKKTDLCA